MSSVGCRLLIVLRGTTAIISKNSELGSIYLPQLLLLLILLFNENTVKKINAEAYKYYSIVPSPQHNDEIFTPPHLCGVDEHHERYRVTNSDACLLL